MCKSLFLMCGVPGSGKSTFIKEQITKTTYKAAYVSRDAIRFGMVKEDEEYFSKEDEVFKEFIEQINRALKMCEVVYVDATHLNEKSRNKVLDLIDLNNVDIYPIDFNISLETCLNQNENRKGTRAYVPREVIRRMYMSYQAPTENEKHKYKMILTVKEKRNDLFD